jgi:hypothetical protein
MVQPLPAFLGVPTAGRGSAGTPEAVSSGLRQGDIPKLLVSAKMESFTAAGRNVTS